jgi:hypothetical protein
MGKAQSPGVQHLALCRLNDLQNFVALVAPSGNRFFQFTGSIHFVAHDGMLHGRTMDPNLVGSPGF